jgi:hypothetical protein
LAIVSKIVPIRIAFFVCSSGQQTFQRRTILPSKLFSAFRAHGVTLGTSPALCPERGSSGTGESDGPGRPGPFIFLPPRERLVPLGGQNCPGPKSQRTRPHRVPWLASGPLWRVGERARYPEKRHGVESPLPRLVSHGAFFSLYLQERYEEAYQEAQLFQMPQIFWDPLLRAAILGRLGRGPEAAQAAAELLHLRTDFSTSGRFLISCFVKFDSLIDAILADFRQAGLLI